MAGYEGGTGLAARARTLAADGVAAEVIDAFAGRGIEAVLLKGPVLQRWLYSDDDRDYADVDLLVGPPSHRRAEGVLRELGYTRVLEPTAPVRRGILHSQPWGRPGVQPHVDLHRTLFGMGVGPETVWAELAPHMRGTTVAGTAVTVLGEPALALLVAVHAAQHEGQPTKATEDLRRAIDKLALGTWRSAAELAQRLNAGPTMSLGLALVPGGAALAEEIGLVDPRLARAATREGAHGATAIGIDTLWRERRQGERVRMLARKFFPPRDFIYGWAPIARRGRAGMALAYLWRPLWLLGSAGPGLIAWLRFRAESRR